MAEITGEMDQSQFHPENEIVQTEEEKQQARVTYWTEYAKTHQPEDTGRMLAQIEKEADTDGLTDIANKRSWDKQVEIFSALAERKGQPLSFFVIDIDDFKKINNTWGHDFGDQVLVYVGGFFKNKLRKYDFPARVGGDEFAVLLPETDNIEATNVRKRLIEELHKSFTEMGDEDVVKAVELSLSIGVSTKLPNESPQEAIIRADKDMYQVKATNKNV